MLLFKIQSSVFALATMMLIASSSTTTSVVSAIGNTSGGGIRGATSKDADPTQVQFSNNNNQGHQRRRHLKDKYIPVPVPAVVASPTLPPAPVAPPTPTGVNEWTSRCDSETRALNNCVPSSGRLQEGCTRCLYANSFTSGNPISGCRSFCQSACDVFAKIFYDCGAMIMDPTSAPVVPVVPDSTPTDPPIVLVDPISLSFTQTGCPATGVSGQACTVPSPFLYQECYYGGNMRCTCRPDPGSVFLCNLDPSGSVQAPQPAPTGTEPAPTTSTDPAPPVSMEMGGTGCPARLSDLEDGSSCAGLVPDEKASIGCGYEEIVGSPPTSSENIICECVKANPLWACRSLGVTPIAAPNECPPQDSPPANGDSCAGLLVTENSAQTCMFSRRFSTSNELETFNCECSNAAGSTVDLWSCDGSFMPVVAPSLMPAGQIQPSTTIPVPAAPTAPTATTPTECGTFPGDGTTCAGVLPVGLSSASCNYSQTITTDGVPLDETATCECDAATEIWNCVGSLTPAPPNAVPVVPTMMPILSGVPAPTMMPILSGVPAPTMMPILSGVPAPTETTPPAPADGSIAIPNSVDFSSGSAICPAKITNCEPCAAFFPDAIEGSCTQFTQITYEGVLTPFQIQCRCPEQEINNPTWSCRFIGGNENSITIPASPICAPEDYIPSEDFPEDFTDPEGPEGPEDSTDPEGPEGPELDFFNSGEDFFP